MLPSLFPRVEKKLVTLHSQRRPTTWLSWIACAFFFLAGLTYIPLIGIEGDETLFAVGIYQPRGELFTLRVGHSHVPIMLMSYVGALKSWIYRPILKLFGTGPATLRLPGLLAGTISIWLFFLVLRKVAGERAAIVGCGMLAVDSMYLLTATFDWGPVALQHLLLAAGILLILRFVQEGRLAMLFWGFCCLGLMLWDKALALWMLGGLGVASVAVFPRQVLRVITFRTLSIACFGLLLGAFPLFLYNFSHHWTTFRSNYHRDTISIRDKAIFLANASDGAGLFDWMPAEASETPVPHEPAGGLPRVSAAISAVAGHPRHHLLPYAFGLAVLLLPLLRGNALRIVVFTLIAMGVAWFQMAITANTGLSLHHTILLWPLPQTAIAVSFAAASRRLGRAGIPALATVMAVFLASGALVMNEYYITMVRYGGNQAWNGAIYSLAAYLKDVRATRVVCMDWGIAEPLQFLDRGKLPLGWAEDSLAKPELTDEDRAALLPTIADPGNVYVGHREKYEFFRGRSPRFVKAAQESGYRQQLMKVVGDGYGRDFFEVYRIVKDRAGD